MVRERGLWLEIVTLVVPGFNDSEAELRAIAKFIASVSRDIPWHVTAFHPDYKMTDPPATDRAPAHSRGGNRRGGGIALCLCRQFAGTRGLIGKARFVRVATNCSSNAPAISCATIKSPATANVRAASRTIPGIWPGGGAAEVNTGDSTADFYQRRPRRVKPS